MKYSFERVDSTLPVSSSQNKRIATFIVLFSIIANIIILLLFFTPLGYKGKVNFDVYMLPRFEAILNSFTFIFLWAAFISIRLKKINLHRGFILSAFCCTTLFLLCYLSFHFLAPPPHYGGVGLVRTIYLIILVTHSTLAAIILPLALFSLYWGWTMQVNKHKKIVRWTLPIWLYVALTGVIVYLMESPYF